MSTSPSTAEPTVVALDSGPVTLVPLDQFTIRMRELEHRAKTLRLEATQLNSAADGRFAEAGAILAPARSQWHSEEAAPQLARVDELVAAVGSADAQRQRIDERDRQGIKGLFRRLTDYEENRRITRSRNQNAAQLQVALIALAKGIASPTTPEADRILEEARSETTHVGERTARAEAIQNNVNTMKQEIDRRNQVVSRLGFDALYELGWLKTYGAPPVNTALVLHKGEVPYVSTAATLARQTTQTQFVGSSQGFSFPIGHTGIRYRVGSVGGKPIQRSTMASIDSGELVLTNMRVAFIGRLKTISVALPKVVNIHMYTDSLSLFHEGKENADFFYLSSPQRFLFYFNYLVDGLGS